MYVVYFVNIVSYDYVVFVMFLDKESVVVFLVIRFGVDDILNII